MTKPKVITLGLLALLVLAMLCAQRTMTAGVSPAHVAEPARAQLSVSSEGGKIVLRGGVPDVTLKQQLVAKAYQAFGAGNVVNQLTIEPNVRSEDWLPRAGEVIMRLKNWGTAAVAFDGSKVVVTGDVKTDTDKIKRQEELGALLGSTAKIDSQLHVTGGSASAASIPAAPAQTASNTTSSQSAPIAHAPAASTPSPAPAAVAAPAPAPVAKPAPVAAAASPKATAMVSKIHDVMSGKTIDFEIGSATLTPGSAKLLDELVPILQADKDVRVEIGGHTDNYGDPRFNQMVSQARAVAVAQYLIGRGVDSHRLVSKGYGDAKPVASNKHRDGRKLNRRVTFHAL
ncbi:MAG: OmpA family protein [Nitrospiraceae bacterium]